MDRIGTSGAVTQYGSSLPVWDAEALTPPVSDPFESGMSNPRERASFRSNPIHRGVKSERGRHMARFMRIAAALSALATIFLVAGAGSKY